MNPALVAASGLLGVAAGALANGLAARIGSARYAEVRVELDATGMDEGMRFVAPMRPSSATCDSCGADLLVGPTLPWLAAGGRCRTCRHPRRTSLLVAELVTAVAFGALAARYGTTATLVPLFALSTAMVAASLVDLAYGRLPDAITFPTLAIVAVLIPTVALGQDTPRAIVGAAVGAAVYFGFLFVMHFIWPRGMGFGDVKLALPMGATLGWLGWSSTYPVLGPIVLVMDAAMVGSFLGAVGGLVIARALRTTFPLGPFLAVGTFVVLLFATSLRPA